ncbi:MAG: hypothetical protein H6Q68_1414 [Firmicutes bacterium]|nr:hypothetical protein [Bacillota bacterium]
MKYIILIILWCTWCTVHSGMISLTITNYLRDRLGRKYRFYRLFYNVISLTTMIPIILYGANLTGQVLFRWDGFLLIVKLILVITALLLFILGAIKYDIVHFFGIRQIKYGSSHSALSKTGAIDTSGILRITRHPWYLAAIIFIWTGYREMYVSTLIVNMILTVYIMIGTVLEERKLIIEHGDNYRDYIARVSMLFPFKWIVFKLSLDSKKYMHM